MQIASAASLGISLTVVIDGQRMPIDRVFVGRHAGVCANCWGHQCFAGRATARSRFRAARSVPCTYSVQYYIADGELQKLLVDCCPENPLEHAVTWHRHSDKGGKLSPDGEYEFRFELGHWLQGCESVTSVQ